MQSDFLCSRLDMSSQHRRQYRGDLLLMLRGCQKLLLLGIRQESAFHQHSRMLGVLHQIDPISPLGTAAAARCQRFGKSRL